MNFDEKHEPQTFAELIFAEQTARATCERYATGKPSKPLMLWGEPGTAKTTTARVIVRDRYRAAGGEGAIQEFNAAELTAADFNKLSNIASYLDMAFGDPLILINEFDEFDKETQPKFRAWMDAHRWVNLIVTTNEKPNVTGVYQKLMPALRSRFERVELKPPSLSDCLPRAQAILQQEGINVSHAQLSTLLSTFNGDIRDMMPLLEEAVEQLRRGILPQPPKPKLRAV